MEIIEKIKSALNGVGIDCASEFGRQRNCSAVQKKISAYAGIKKVRFERLRNGMADAFTQVRVTVQAFGAEGEAVQDAAEKIVIPAVMGCGEEIFGAEISEVRYDVKSDRVYCEIIFEVKRCGYEICGG